MNTMNNEGASGSNLNRNVAAGEDAHANWMESLNSFLDDEIPTADIFSFVSGMQDHLQPPSQSHTETITEERSTLCQQENPQHLANQAHSAAEKRRRDKFKEKIKVLEELLPNCVKKDTTSILEEAIKSIQLLKYQVEWFKASYLSSGDSQISSMHMEMATPAFISTRLASANVIGRVGFVVDANAGISPVHATMVSPTLIIPTRSANANVIDIGASADERTTLYPTMLAPQTQIQPFHIASLLTPPVQALPQGGSSSCGQTSNASS